MRLLITGGAGFLGSNLGLKLLSEGHEVIAVDNMVTGSEKNIVNLKKHKNFKLINHDIIEYKEFLVLDERLKEF
jgi:nucleoside-diphosphate-sugar epimerase